MFEQACIVHVSRLLGLARMAGGSSWGLIRCFRAAPYIKASQRNIRS